MTIREKVLLAANRAVNGHRNASYGKPEDNFGRIALLWNAHLVNVGLIDISEIQKGTGLQPSDIALMMDLFKTARLQSDPKHVDSWIDKAGYVACGAECEQIDIDSSTLSAVSDLSE